MDTAELLGLHATAEPWRWRLPVRPEICSGIGALFGGCGMAAAVEAAERVTGRPLVWATTQFLSFARPPATLDLAVTVAASGHRVTQARVVAYQGGEEILTLNAALGHRDLDLAGTWAQPPRVPPPGGCPPRQLRPTHLGTILERVETRLAMARPAEAFPGPPGDGRSALWLRVAEVTTGAGLLAILGDYVPFGISQALGERVGGNSLDNTLRVVDVVPTEWVLADVRVHAVARGFAHGVVHLWSEDMRLLAVAAQSAIVRRWQGDRGPAPTAWRDPDGG